MWQNKDIESSFTAKKIDKKPITLTTYSEDDVSQSVTKRAASVGKV
jgi:hypothetical protein